MTIRDYLKEKGFKWPERINKIPGKGCKCGAHGSCECLCEVDWTDYKTRNEVLSYLEPVLDMELPNHSDVSPHQLYKMADGKIDAYKELMLAHGYLIPKVNKEPK